VESTTTAAKFDTLWQLIMLKTERYAKINSITNSGGYCGARSSKQCDDHNILWSGCGMLDTGCSWLLAGQAAGETKTE